MKIPSERTSFVASAVACAALCLAALPACGSGGGGSTTAAGVTFVPANAPRITLVDPLHGPIGQSVTIQGSNFTAGAANDAVFFGTTQATVLSATTGEIATRVPPGVASGSLQVTVSTASGTSAGAAFSVDPQGGGTSVPAITNVQPPSGPIGTSVTISGSAFDPSAGGNTVTFNGTRATVSSASATQLSVVVPGGATSGSVVVVTSAGTSNGWSFVVTRASGPDGTSSGARAAELLTASPYTTLLVTIDHIQGEAPDSAAMALLETRLSERCNKPGGITVQLGNQIPPQGVTTWDLNGVRALEDQTRTAYATGNTAVLYLLYVNGGYTGDTASSKILGISYRGSSIVIFKDNITSSAVVGTLSSSSIEQAVLVHEAGHNLGLVNNGAPMQTNHLDAGGHGNHDSSTRCVMYYQIESSLISQLLTGVPTQYDTPCIQDLQALGGK